LNSKIWLLQWQGEAEWRDVCFSLLSNCYRPNFFLKKFVNEPHAKNKDACLLRRIALKDYHAFAEFYDEYSTLLFSIAYRILNNFGEAEDVLQETLMQIWEKAEKYNAKLGSATSWAAMLARNKAIDRIRASNRRIRLAKEAEAEYIVMAESDAAGNGAVHGHDKTQMIQTALLKLPPEQNRAIALAYFSGLTQHEISEKLREPLGTIKARIRRGMLNLRDQLENLASERSYCRPRPSERDYRVKLHPAQAGITS
jgi:RNA polymerase sigma-70 factor (ECF subfamily)